jgi:hypothetical protein
MENKKKTKFPENFLILAIHRHSAFKLIKQGVILVGFWTPEWKTHPGSEYSNTIAILNHQPDEKHTSEFRSKKFLDWDRQHRTGFHSNIPHLQRKVVTSQQKLDIPHLNQHSFLGKKHS